jgi:hypothetical protein
LEQTAARAGNGNAWRARILTFALDDTGKLKKIRKFGCSEGRYCIEVAFWKVKRAGFETGTCRCNVRAWTFGFGRHATLAAAF